MQAHDAVRGLTRLAFDGGALEVPLRADPLGTRLRIRVRARDVAVARQAPQEASIHIVLPCRLAAIETGGDPHERLLRLQVGPASLLARVLRDAVGRLGLAPGDALFALVKGIALEHTPVGAPSGAVDANDATDAAAATGAGAARPSWR